MRLPALLLILGAFSPASADEYDVALLRPTAYLSERPGAGSEVHRYFSATRDILTAAGLRHRTVDEDEILADEVPPSEFLICPYNPYMTAEVAAAVGRFLDAGGRALLCYFCEDSLRARLGLGELMYSAGGDEGLFRSLKPTGFAPEGMPASIKQGSWNAYLLASLDAGISKPILEWIAADGNTNSGPALTMSPEAAWFGHVMVPGDTSTKALMLLALIGHRRPGVWDQAADHALRPDLDFRLAATLDALCALAENTPARDMAHQAVARYEELKAARTSRKPWQIVQAAAAWREGLEGIYLRCLPSRPDQMRGAWVVMPGGVGDWGWEKTARVAAENGLTDLFVRVAWGGRASYPGAVIPTRLQPGEDLLAEGLAACHRHGLRYHAWFINLNWRMPPEEIISDLAQKGFWQISPEGDQTVQEGSGRSHWLNPSEPGVVDLQARMMAEVARNYDVDGVHFDYIRYENYNGSYGPRDRERFEQWAGENVGRWPGDVLPGRGETPAGPLHERFLEWRCEQVSNVVRACAGAVREVAPDCRISAAVYPSWPHHRLVVGQDWVRWLDEGWLDFVCPMTYDAPGYYDRHLDRVRRQREAAGDKPLIVGIGSWLHPKVVTVAEAIVADRRLGADGFVLFSYTPELGELFLPALRESVFAD